MSNTPANSNQTPSTPVAPSKLPKSAMAVAALVLAIIALLSSFLPFINMLAFLLVILAIIFGIVGLVGICRNQKSGMGIAIASLVIAAIAGGAILLSGAVYTAAVEEASTELDKATGDATEEILGSEVDVTLGDLTMKKSSYGMIESSMPITVKNLTDESHSYQIQVEAVNASGDRITQDYAYVNDLAAGQSQTVKTFTLITSDEYDAMKKSTIKLVSVSQY